MTLIYKHLLIVTLLLQSTLIGIFAQTQPTRSRSPSPDWDLLLSIPIEPGLFDPVPILHHHEMVQTSNSQLKREGKGKTSIKKETIPKRKTDMTPKQMFNARRKRYRDNLRSKDPEAYHEKVKIERKQWESKLDKDAIDAMKRRKNESRKSKLQQLHEPGNEEKLKEYQAKRRKYANDQGRRDEEKFKSGVATERLRQSKENGKFRVKEWKRMARIRKKAGNDQIHHGIPEEAHANFFE